MHYNRYELDYDVIDLRDVLERIADLESEIGSDEEIDTDQEELADLNGFVEAVSAVFGISAVEVAEEEPVIINASYWVEYVKELANDLGIEPVDEWPSRHIDWKAAADELEMDYARFDYDGTEYLIRSY